METTDSDGSYFFVKFLIVLALLLPQSTWADSTNFESVEASVRNYFKDTPVMIEIARCESKFKQFETDGSPLYGGWLNGMVGVFQLFERVHINSAKALGFKLDTLEGNLAYAKHLYATAGTKPWNSSKTCWGNAVSSVSSKKVSTSNQTIEQKRAELIKQIIALMKIIEARQKVALNN